MARTAIYKGGDCNLGRHGRVKTGDEITLTEVEADYVKNDPQFAVTGPPMRSGREIIPCPHPAYNLTTLPWGTPYIKRAVDRLGPVALLAVGAAMSDVLGLPLFVTRGMSRAAMADVINEKARDAGWA